MKKIISFIVTVAVVISLFTGCGKEDVYRLIKVNSFEGEVTVERDEKMDVFKGLQLISDDSVEVGNNSLLELLADSDKHIVAEENTVFSIETVGNEEKGSITIDLEYGSALITIDNKLNDNSSFEVNTPNATLSVRGTIFHVAYTPETNTTVVEVREGVVEATSEDDNEKLTAGEIAIIEDDEIEVSDTDNSENSNESKPDVSDATTEEQGTFNYTENAAFEIRDFETFDYSGISVNQLVGWTAVPSAKGSNDPDNFIKDGITIHYWVVSEAEMIRATTDSQPYIENVYSLENGDGQNIACLKCNFNTTNGDIEVVYQYFKKISNDKFITIVVTANEKGKALEGTDINTYLPLTEDKFYTYN